MLVILVYGEYYGRVYEVYNIRVLTSLVWGSLTLAPITTELGSVFDSPQTKGKEAKYRLTKNPQRGSRGDDLFSD